MYPIMSQECNWKWGEHLYVDTLSIGQSLVFPEKIGLSPDGESVYFLGLIYTPYSNRGNSYKI